MPPKVSLEYKEVTRDRILDSAERLFEKKGYYDTSMDDIVKESKMSKGAIYGYFSSKEELFESLQERDYAQSFQSSLALLEAKMSAREKLEKLADIYFLSNDEDAKAWCRMYIEFSAASMHLKQAHAKLEGRMGDIHKLIVTILREGIKNGEFRKGIDIDSIASVLIATVDGLTLHWAIKNEDIDWNRVKSALVDLALQGIALNSPSRSSSSRSE